MGPSGMVSSRPYAWITIRRYLIKELDLSLADVRIKKPPRQIFNSTVSLSLN